MRRCVGMADEGDSKSLVLITRVGSTPTTGMKENRLETLISGRFLLFITHYLTHFALLLLADPGGAFLFQLFKVGAVFCFKLFFMRLEFGIQLREILLPLAAVLLFLAGGFPLCRFFPAASSCSIYSTVRSSTLPP